MVVVVVASSSNVASHTLSLSVCVKDRSKVALHSFSEVVVAVVLLYYSVPLSISLPLSVTHSLSVSPSLSLLLSLSLSLSLSLCVCIPRKTIASQFVARSVAVEGLSRYNHQTGSAA